MNTVNQLETRGALFSDDRLYRYRLEIRWSEGDLVQFIGLNPSTADEISDDPTIRRCKGFSKAMGAGGMVMTNLFAWRSTDPKGLPLTDRAIGESGPYGDFDNRNDYVLWETYKLCPTRIACWGTHGKLLYRAAKVKIMLPGLSCLSKTKDGMPGHPLYLKSDCRPFPL